MGAASPHRAPAPPGSASAMGSATPTRAALCCRVRPQPGNAPGRCGPRASAPGSSATAQRVPAPRAGPAHRLQGVVQRGHARLEPRHRGRHSLRETRARPREAVLLCGPPDAQGAGGPSGAPRLPLGVRQRSRRRADPVGTVGRGAGIPLSFSELARSSGQILGLPRVDDDDGRGGRRGQALVPARSRATGGQHHQGVGWRASAGPARRPPRWHRWGRLPLPGGAQGGVHWSLATARPTKHGTSLIRTPIRPRPYGYGLKRRRTTVGLEESRT